MTGKRRELLLRLADGKKELLPAMWHMDRWVRADEMVDWLIRRGFTGDAFNELFMHQFNGSFLELGRFVLAQVEREKPKPIIAGRDYR